MDLAYDRLAEEAFNPVDRAATPKPDTRSSTDPSATPTPSSPRQSLQSEFQETFKAFSNSPWGATLGGFWGNVKKQGESLYEEAKKEATEMAQDMENLRLKGAQGLGFGTEQKNQDSDNTNTTEKAADTAEEAGDEARDPTDLQDTDTFLARFKVEAAKRLKEVQKAEDAADEALLRFGTNIRNFLRDAVSVTGPDEDASSNHTPGSVLFESKDGSSGKRVIHTSRFDAQLHVIHTTLTSFTEDPAGAGGQWEDFGAAFDVDAMTSHIAEDLSKYPELRTSMEKLVPDKVEYRDFWTRYYFLRHVVETQEEKRKELLKASTTSTEEIAWDEDTDDDSSSPAKPSSTNPSSVPVPKVLLAQNTNDSSTTIHQTTPPPAAENSSTTSLQPSRRSHDEKSVADSDASYDLVSGATSRAPGSPKEDLGVGKAAKVEESDEEDWE